MSLENKYKKLSEVEHVLTRPGRYIGSINKEVRNTWFINDNNIKNGKVNISPGFHKLFDEIISNSADHSRTPEGKHLTEVRVDVDKLNNVISVYDNGGIPVEVHKEYNQYIPDMIFGELRSGSNFNDDDDSLATGQNGEGSSLCNIFSKEFTVETALGGKSFMMTYSDNMSNKTDPKISKSKFNFTRITYSIDLARLNMTEISDDDLLMLERRTYEIAFTNPHLNVYFNNKKISVNCFEKFVKLYDKNSIYYECDSRWKLGISFSDKGFNHISFVNSTPSFDGGTHVDYVVDKIVDAVRDKIKKKTKIDVKPSEIKNNITVLLDCNINNPRYNSQTKEKLITQPKDFGSQFTLDEKFIKKLLSSSVIDNIIECIMRKKELDDIKDLENKAKSFKSKGFHDIPKYRPATNKNRDNCIIFVLEGDSAAKPLYAAADPKIHGIFALKGKPENCYAKKLTDVVSEEFMNLSRILNLSITKPDYTNMRYSKVVLACDSDSDGMHIISLLILLIKKFWQPLLDERKVEIFQTPSVIVKYKNKNYNFVYESDYDEFVKDKSGYTTKYCKGLGGHDTKTFKTFLDDPDSYVLVDYDPDRDDDLLGLAFDPKRADDRKLWVGGNI